MSLLDSYCVIVDSLQSKPKNEAQTRMWVLDRVLQEVLGYETVEIVPEQTGPGNTRPDYTILPDTQHTWLLEAKSWTEHVSDQHGVQATTYTYQEGRKWVVVSNGQEGRLYDSSVTGTAERLVLRATRDEPKALEALFQALQRETVVAGKLEIEPAPYLLVEYLRTELQDAASDCVKALHTVARKKPRFKKTTPSDIVYAIPEAFAPPEVRKVVTPEPSADETASEPAVVPPSDGEGVPLDAAGRVTKKKPEVLILPDGARRSVNTWTSVWIEVVRYGAAHGSRPLPVPWSFGKSRRYWINREPRWPNGEGMRHPKRVPIGDTEVYIELHDSAVGLLRVVRHFCRAMGIDPSTIRIVYG